MMNEAIKKLFGTICIFLIILLISSCYEDTDEKKVKHEVVIDGPLSGMQFVYIPPGKFMMGSPNDESGRYDNEKQGQVRLTKGFYMQTTEVTQRQWAEVMGNNPSKFKGCDNCPVETVTWNDAQEFINKLNLKTGKKYRLPIEAEWEYACRAGTVTRFSWGDEADCSMANYGNGYSKDCKDKNPKQTSPVRNYSPNAWGLYDMHGNVWEWCQDKWPFFGSERVYRGGSWGADANLCRSAYRGSLRPSYRSGGVGFRVLKEVP